MTTNKNEKLYGRHKVYASCIERLGRDEAIMPSNCKHLLQFLQNFENKQFTIHRNLYYLHRLRLAAQHIKVDFKDAEATDINEMLSSIRKTGYMRGGKRSDYSKAYFSDLNISLKMFYRWLFELDASDKLPKCVKGLANIKYGNKIERQDLISQEEYARILNACDLAPVNNKTRIARDKALFALLFQTGARIGELANLRIMDIRIAADGRGLDIDYTGKTGKRTFPLYEDCHLIQNWLEKHPRRNEQNAPFFCSIAKNNFGKSLTYKGLRRSFDITIKHAAVNGRNVYPHLFRHTAATRLDADPTLTDSIVKKLMGWSASSNMLANYSHLNTADVRAAMKRRSGIKDIHETDNPNEIKCRGCGKVSAKTLRYCATCGINLHLNKDWVDASIDKEKQKDNEVITALADFIKNSPDLEKRFADMIKERGQPNGV